MQAVALVQRAERHRRCADLLENDRDGTLFAVKICDCERNTLAFCADTHPYVLISILSALHDGVFTLAEVQGELEMLFEKQYILKASFPLTYAECVKMEV